MSSPSGDQQWIYQYVQRLWRQKYTENQLGTRQIICSNLIHMWKSKQPMKCCKSQMQKHTDLIVTHNAIDLFEKTQWTNTSRWHCTPNHHRLWKLNTGFQATWAMSFFTLPPHSRTLVSKWSTKLALIWKEDFGPLDNSPVLLLSPGKTPLMTTVAKFLDTSVCGGSWCLDPSLSPFLVKFTQILESILLENPHNNAAVLSVGCASFSSTLFPSTQLSVNMLGYSTLCTASLFGNECLWLSLLVKGVNDCLLDNCQISSLPNDCVACETILKAQETFAGVLSWLADWHVTIF